MSECHTGPYPSSRLYANHYNTTTAARHIWESLWESKIQNPTPPSNHFWILSLNFCWIFIWVVKTQKCCFGFLKFWVYHFKQFVFRKFLNFCTLWINWKVRDRHVVTTYIIGKPYNYGESNDTITFDLEWPWRSKSRSLRFWCLVSC